MVTYLKSFPTPPLESKGCVETEVQQLFTQVLEIQRVSLG